MSATALAIISLLFLVAAIAIGSIKNINTGLIGIAFAMICGVYICGIKAKAVVAYWPVDLCMTLMGMTFLFSIVNKNGSLRVVAEALTRLVGGKAKLMPFVFFLLPAVLGYCGVAGPTVLAISGPIIMALAHENNIEDFDATICAVSGCCAGSLNKINASGAVAFNYGGEAWEAMGKNIADYNYTKVFIAVVIVFTIEFFVMYFARGMFKYKDVENAKKDKIAVTKEQTITLIVVALALLAMLLLGTHTGLTAFFAGTLLLILGIGNTKEAIAGTSWATVLMVGGMTLLIKVVGTAGGIKLISDALSAVMGQNTASGLFAVIGGLMSCVSSASGVVMPSLIPTIPELVASIPNLSFYGCLAGIVIGAHAVTFSPLSTLGALMLSASDESKKDKLFTKQLVFAICSTIASAIVMCLISVLGLL